ncbi:hypothetical protein H1R20_g664, partial [Candolleomyces eurysporus]
MSDTEDYLTIKELAQVNANPPTARTLLCNHCNMPIFGDNWLAPLFAVFCWDNILQIMERCMHYGCDNKFLKKTVMYLTEDCHDLLSMEQDTMQQLILELFKRLNEDIAVVKAQNKRQQQQIKELTQMNAVLEDQVVQSAGRLEAVHNKTNQLKALAVKANQQTDGIVKSNKELAAQICIIRAQVCGDESVSTLFTDQEEKIQALDRMAATIRTTNT